MRRNQASGTTDASLETETMKLLKKTAIHEKKPHSGINGLFTALERRNRMKMKTALIACAALLATSCQFWNIPVREYFEEYTSTAAIERHLPISGSQQADGAIQIPSDQDVIVTFHLQNPQNFTFAAGSNMTLQLASFDAAKALASSGLPADTASVRITQDSSDKSILHLTYPAAFLQAADTGFDISPSVHLEHPFSHTDFGTYAKLKLLCNTAPPAFRSASLAQTKDASPRYVICLRIPDMGKRLRTALIHRDVNAITVNGTKYPLKINAADTNFEQPAAPFLARQDVGVLAAAGQAPESIPNGSWTLFYDTGIEIAANGGKAVPFVFTLNDEAGLSSVEYKTSTNPKKPEPVMITLDTATGSADAEADLNEENEETAPHSIKLASKRNAVVLRASSATAAASVHVKITGGASGAPMEAVGNPAEFSLTLADGQESMLYRVEAYADAADYENTATKTFYYMVTRGLSATVEIDGAQPYAWARLKKAVKDAEAYTGIIITGTVHATADAADVTGVGEDNFGEIVINKPLTVSAKGAAALNANKTAGGKAAHRIFSVQDGGALTVENLTLTGGSANVGGAALIARGGRMTLKGGTVTDNAATQNGGGLAIIGGTCTVSSATINGNAAGGKGSGIYFGKDASGAAGVLTLAGEAKVGSVSAPSDSVYIPKDLAVSAAALNGSAYINVEPEDYGYAAQKNAPLVTGAGAAAYKPYFSLSGMPEGEAWSLVPNGSADNALVLKKADSVIKEGNGAWARLKEAIAAAEDGSVIFIDGVIRADTSSQDNYGELVIAKKLTIQGINKTGTHALDANKAALGSSAHRIFTVKTGAALTLDGVQLTNGKAAGSGNDGQGGAVFGEKHAQITINGGAAHGCEAADSGGAFAAHGASLTLNGTAVKGNRAGRDGGALFATADGVVPARVLITGGAFGGAAADANQAAANGGAIAFSGAGSTLRIDGATFGGNKADSGGAIFASGTAVTIRGGAFSANEAKTSGGAVNINGAGGALSIEGATFGGNKAGSGGAIFASGSSVIIGGGAFTANEAQTSGGAVAVSGAGATLSIEGATFGGNKADNGGALFVSGATLKIRGGSFSANSVKRSGGALFIENASSQAAKADIDGNAVFSANSGKTGGALAVSGAVTLGITGGTIEKNTAESGSALHLSGKEASATLSSVQVKENAGSALVSEGKALSLADCLIENNDGYGVGIAGGTAVMSGGAIKDNKNSGVCITDGAFTLKTGSISGNTARGNGGGVLIRASDAEKRPSFIMEDGRIEGNKAAKTADAAGDGGGVYVAGGAFVMNGGAMQGNEAAKTGSAYSGKGGGVAVERGTFEMSGSAAVVPSAAPNEHERGVNDVYLKTGSLITVTGALTASAAARISPESYAADSAVVKGSGTFTVPADYAQKFTVTKQDASTYWTLKQIGNALCLTNPGVEGSTPYTVRHYQEKVDGSYDEANPEATDALTGAANKAAFVPRKNYPGFVFDRQEPASPTITANGSTVVKVYYKRKTVTVTFKPAGGTIAGNASDKTVSAKFGAPLAAPAPARTGYTFKRWNPAVPQNVPAENATYAAEWTAHTYTVRFDASGATGSMADQAFTYGQEQALRPNAFLKAGYTFAGWAKTAGGMAEHGNGVKVKNLTDVNGATITLYAVWQASGNTPYRVEHYLERPDGSGYDIAGGYTDDKTGKAGEPVAYVIRADAGFTYNAARTEINGSVTTTGTINGDGTTVVKLYYDRKTITVTFKLAGGSVDTSNRQEVKLTGKYGAPLTPPVPSRNGYDFTGWDPPLAASPKFPNANAEHTAQWTRKTIEIDGSAPDAWKRLKEAVGSAEDGDIIVIQGTVQATNDSGNNGEIAVGKNITVKKADNASSAALDANKEEGSKPAHRIFTVASGKTLTLENLTLKGGSAHGTGEAGLGGVIYTNGGSVTIKGCTLTENHADYHGGCVYAERGTVAITGSTFTGNNTSHHGGAVYTADGSASMTDCAFTANTVASGGGGAVWIKSGSVSMARSSFTGNKGSSNDDIGGAVRITGGTVEITACTFTGNEAFSGGAIGVKGDAGTRTSVTISGGVIGGTNAADANTTKSGYGDGGGAIRVGNGATVTLQDYVEGGTAQGVRIIGNKAASGGNGGGVYVEGSGATFTIKGASCVTPSTGMDADKPLENDVYLNGEAKITVGGSLNPQDGIAARITVEDHKYAATTQVLAGTAALLSAEHRKFAVTPQDEHPPKEWAVDSNGKLKEKSVIVKHGDPDAWKKLKDAVSAIADGGTIYIDGLIEATAASGNNGEILVTKNLTIKPKNSAAVLDADYETGGKPAHRIFKVDGASATLTLENLTLKNGYAKTAGDTLGGGILVTNGGKLTLKNTTISTCIADYGGAVNVKGSSSSVTMESGSLTANTATTIGGAVNVDNGASFTMNGGTINGNTGKSGGGGAYVHEGTFTLGAGALITSNTAEGRNGGGVYVDSGGTLAIGGGAIKSNNATKSGSAVGNGGGVYVFGNTVSKGTVRMTAGEISGNAAGLDGAAYIGDGGGVYNEGGTVEISGGEIKSNTAQDGGGIYVKGADATLTMSSGTISANNAEKDSPADTAGGNGGGVYIYDAAFTLKDGAISNNTAARDAGGVQLFGGTFTMEGGVIEGNTVTGTSTASGTGRAGGVEIVAATMNMKGGEIKNNTAKNGGGGVSLGLSGASHSVLNMTGGTISGNTLTETSGTGKGVEFFTNSTTHDITYYTILKMSGSAKIDTNNDVYLKDGATDSHGIKKPESTITVEGALENNPAAIITPETYTAGRKALEGSAAGSEYGKFKVTPKVGENWRVGSDGKLHQETVSISSSATDKWKRLKDAVRDVADGGTIIIEGLVQSTSADGNNGEIIIDKDLTIEAKTGTATLDANESAFTDTEVKHRIFRVKGGKTLTLKNLTLKNGYAGKRTVDYSGTTGGGIRLESGKVSLSGVTISDCKARTTPVLGGGGSWHGDGAGIYVVSGTVTMENTTLSTNIAAAHGGAVYLNGGTLTMKGSSVITPLTVSNANKTGKNDVHLKGGAKIIVDDALTGTAPVARIRVAYNEYLPTRQVLDGTAVASHNTKFIVTDQDLGTDNGGVHVRKWKIKSNGYLQSEEVTLDGSKLRAWQALKDAVHTASDGDVIAISGEVKATNEGTGIYINSGEIVIDKDLTIKRADTAATAVLDANSNHSGTSPADAPAVKHRIFKVDAGKTLTLQNLTLKGGVAEGTGEAGFGGAIYTKGGTVTITNCTLTGNTAAKSGGAIYAEKADSGSNPAATVTINGGTIGGDGTAKNKVTDPFGFGGGIYVNDGCILTLDKYTGGGTPQGVRIIGNEAGRAGGVRANNSTVTMTGCTIRGNKSTDTSTDLSNAGGGGGVYIHGNTSGRPITMTDCTIQGNTAAAYGGGMCIEKGTIILTNCTIKGNTAKFGGGIYVRKIDTNTSTVTITGGAIGGTGAGDENKATGSGADGGLGGGIYVAKDCALTLKDGAQVIGNDAAFNGAGIYTKGNLTMENCTVTDNKTTGADNNTGGGGVYVESGIVEIKDATKIYHNYTDASGGGIYVNDGTVTLKNATIGGEQYHDGTDSAKTKGNKAKNGGGIYVTGGTLDIKGCTFTYNDSGSGTGGGIKAENIALAMTDCTLTNNKAGTGGGGILTSGTCSLTMKTCILTGNVANFNGGGGVYASGSSFTMTDCTLTGNVAKNTGGGGVYVADGTFTMKGSSRISLSTGAEENEQGKNEVFLTNNKMIAVPAALTGTTPVARITPAAYNTSTQVLTGSAVGTNCNKFRVTPEPATPPKTWAVGSDGKLKTP